MKRSFETTDEDYDAKRQRSDEMVGMYNSEASQPLTPAQAAAEKRRQLLEKMRQLKQQSESLVSQVDQKISVTAPPAPSFNVGGGHARGYQDRPADAYSHTNDAFGEESAKGPKRGRRGRQPSDSDIPRFGRRMSPLDMCRTLINSMLTKSYAPWFKDPVDPVKLNLPDYHTIIAEPMDLGTIKRKLENGQYVHHEEVAADVRLVFSNCIRYNGKTAPVSLDAEKMLQDFEKGYEKVKQRADNADRFSAADMGLDGLDDGDMYRPDSPPMSSSSASRKQRAPRSYYHADPMSTQDKARLSSSISQLPEDKIGGVVEILNLGTQDGEIEIDLERVDPPTLRKLEKYVKSCLSKKKKPAVKREAPQMMLAPPPPIPLPPKSMARPPGARFSGVGVGSAQMNGQMAPAVRNDSESSSDSDSDSDSGSDSGAPMQQQQQQQFQPQQPAGFSQPPSVMNLPPVRVGPGATPAKPAKAAQKPRTPASAGRVPIPPPRPSPAQAPPPLQAGPHLIPGLMPPGFLNSMLNPTLNPMLNPFILQGLMANPGMLGAPAPAQKEVTVQNLDSWASLASADTLPAASSPGLQPMNEAPDPLFANFQKEAKLRQLQEEQRKLEEERLKRERENEQRMAEERRQREAQQAVEAAEEARRRQIEEAREAERRKRESLLQQSQENPPTGFPFF